MDPEAFGNRWLLGAAFLAGGALLVGLLAWLLGGPRDWQPLTGEIGALAGLAIRHIRRVFVVMAAATLGLVGVALLVLPGPGMLVLAAALALLATEFVWARRWIERLRRRLSVLGQEARDLFGDDSRDPPAG